MVARRATTTGRAMATMIHSCDSVGPREPPMRAAVSGLSVAIIDPSAVDEERAETIPIHQSPFAVASHPRQELVLLLGAHQSGLHAPPVKDALPPLLRHRDLRVLRPRL